MAEARPSGGVVDVSAATETNRSYRGAMRPLSEPAPETGGDVDIAAVGALVADPARCRMLLALNDGRALPAGRLAEEAGISPATASGHLAKLTAGGLLTVEARGRQRWYRFAGSAVGNLVEALEQLAPTTRVTSLRQANRARALREARTCYDHLSGRLGVTLMESLLARGHLIGRAGHDPDDVDYAVTGSGEQFLTGFGLPARPRAAEHCVDWSEHRHHLGGPLGRALLDRLLELDWIRRTEIGRGIAVTTAGSDGLATTFGIRTAPGARR